MLCFSEFVKEIEFAKTFSSFDEFLLRSNCGDNDAAILWQLRDCEVNPKSIRDAANLNRTVFANNYGLPLRTVENWEAKVRTPSKGHLLLLAFAVFSNLSK